MRSVLASAQHVGPLRVQKMLHPEGDDPCHAIIVHPPAGIASADQLALEVRVRSNAHVLLTTPGATKWYRSAGPTARCEARLCVETGAALEYLPREAIVFDGARARSMLEMDVAPGGRLLGWELWCLGRTASGERFSAGHLQLETRLTCAGRMRWQERGALAGGTSLLQMAAGFDGQPVFGTLWAAGPEPARELLDECRAVPLDHGGRGALTVMPGLLLARYLGPSTEQGFAWFTALWSRLRPAYLGRAAVPPRVWSA